MIRFRWVSLQLLFLRTLKIPALIWKRLGQLPASLREAYNDTYEIKLESYGEDERSIAKSAFKLLLSLQMPLEHRDFLHALSFCSDDRIILSAEDLLDLCFGFLVFDSGQNVYRFAHLSVREFLETKSDYSPESIHALAAQFCLRYLCTSNDSGPYLITRDACPGSRVDGRETIWKISPSDRKGDAFLGQVQRYACMYWANHTVGSRHFRLARPLNTVLREFVMDASQVVSAWFMYRSRLPIYRFWRSPERHSITWRQGEKIMGMTHDPTDYLFTASTWAFNDSPELRLGSRPDPLLLRSKGAKMVALQLACFHGNRDTVKVLLDCNWGLQADDKQTTLGFAMEGLIESKKVSTSSLINDKFIETIKFLLSCGVDPNEKTRLKNFRNQSFSLPIIEAIETGSTKLVKVLLDHGASADVEDRHGLKAFPAATFKGQVKIAGLLLAASTDVDDFNRTMLKDADPIQRALEENDVTRLITALREWPRDARGNTYLDYAVLMAVHGCSRECVEALLAAGANPKPTFGGWTFN